MKLLTRFKKRKLRPCLEQVPYFLIKNWANSNFYSLGQIHTAYVQQKLPEHSMPYSVALFCTAADFHSFALSHGFRETQAEVIDEISSWFFPGDKPLSGKEIIESLSRHVQEFGDEFHESWAGVYGR